MMAASSVRLTSFLHWRYRSSRRAIKIVLYYSRNIDRETGNAKDFLWLPALTMCQQSVNNHSRWMLHGSGSHCSEWHCIVTNSSLYRMVVRWISRGPYLTRMIRDSWKIVCFDGWWRMRTKKWQKCDAQVATASSGLWAVRALSIETDFHQKTRKIKQICNCFTNVPQRIPSSDVPTRKWRRIFEFDNTFGVIFRDWCFYRTPPSAFINFFETMV